MISIALNANMKPTSALIAENSPALWLAGAAAVREQRRVEVGRLDVQPPGRQRDQRGAHLRFAPGLDAHEDPCDPPRRAARASCA